MKKAIANLMDKYRELYVYCLIGCTGATLDFAAVSAWLATWSRAEGIVIVLTMVCFLLFDFIWGNQTPVERSRRCLIGFSSLAAGCLFTLCVNISAGTGWSVFPSNDNIWPRLFGASVANSGMCPPVPEALAEKQRFVEEYLSDFPDDPAGVCEQMKKSRFAQKN